MHMIQLTVSSDGLTDVITALGPVMGHVQAMHIDVVPGAQDPAPTPPIKVRATGDDVLRQKSTLFALKTMRTKPDDLWTASDVGLSMPEAGFAVVTASGAVSLLVTAGFAERINRSQVRLTDKGREFCLTV